MEEAEDESCLWVWRPAVGEGHVIVTEGHQHALLWGNRRGAVAGGSERKERKRFAVSSGRVCPQRLDKTGRGIFSVSTEWAEGCGAGKGPQGQGWGSANSGHELQLGPRCPVTILATLGDLGQ